jgi:thioredoxin reductase
VFTCPACDGYEALDRDVVVFGWKDPLAAVARGLLRWARSVTVLTQGHELPDEPRGVRVVHTPAAELLGPRGTLEGVRLVDGTVVPCTAAFFHIAQQAKNRLALALDCELDASGAVVVDGDGRTSVEGVFAAGDLTPGMQLTARAVGTGAVAGIACALSM